MYWYLFVQFYLIDSFISFYSYINIKFSQKIIKQVFNQLKSAYQRITMHRQSIERQSPSSSIKTSTNYSMIETRQSEKVPSPHFTQYPSLQKSQKKGIITSISITSQNSSTQNSPQQFPFTIKPQQSVYQQYLISLQNEISSRQRQRQQLQRALDDLQHEYGTVFDELTEEKKKCGMLRGRVEQMEGMMKQSEDKKRGLNNEKQMIFKQYQYQVQKGKILEGNQMKLRSSYDALQKAHQNVQQANESLKQQMTSKTNKLTEPLTRMREQNNLLKQNQQRLQSQLRSLQLMNSNYKSQLNDTVLQKNKIIQVVMREKGYVEREYMKEQKEHGQVRVVVGQRDEQIRQLGKRLVEVEQLHQLQKDRMKYRMSEVVFENSSLVKENEASKLQMKRQLQQLTIQSNQMKSMLNNFQKEKKVDTVHNSQLQKSLLKLQKQINTLLQTRLYLQKQKQSIQQTHQQQLFTVKERLEYLQKIHQQKCSMYDQMYRHFALLQGEFESYRAMMVGNVEALSGQITLLRRESGQRMGVFQREVAKLAEEKNYLIEEVKRIDKENQLVTGELQTGRRGYQQKENQLRRQCSDQVKGLNDSIKLLNNKISQLTEQAQLMKQSNQNEMKSLKIQQQTKLSQMSQISQIITNQTQQKHKSQLNNKTVAINSLTQQLLTHQSTIQQLSNKLSQSILNYQQLEHKLHTQENQLKAEMIKNQHQLKLQFSQLKRTHQLQMFTLQQQMEIIFTRNNHFASQINLLHSALTDIRNNQQQQLQVNYSQSKQNKNKNQQKILHNQSSLPQFQYQSSLIIVKTLKKNLRNLQLQKTSLQSQLLSRQQIHSQLLVKQNHTTQTYQQTIFQLSKQLQHQINLRKQLECGVNSLMKQILSVIQFAQKYSGQSIKKTINNSSTLLTVTNQNPVNRQQNNAFQTCKIYCQSISTFIGERLYVISVLMQENTQLKQQLQKKCTQNNILTQKLTQQTVKYQQLHKQYTNAVKQVQSLKTSIQQTSKQNTLSISSLKYHIASYKRQLTRYESQIQHISHKFQQHQLKDINSSTQIALLQQNIQHLREQLQGVKKQLQNKKLQLSVLRQQFIVKNSQIQTKIQELINARQEMQKIAHKHVLQVQQIKMINFSEVQLLKEEFLSQRKSFKLQLQSLINKLNQQSITNKQKTRHLQKLLQTKSKQYHELQSHFALSLQTKKQSHTTQLTSLQNQIKYLHKKSHSPSKQIMRNKMLSLQSHVEDLEKQLQILQDNNKLLRKNYISALAQQENLRDQIKQNKSQRSQSRNNSRQPSRNNSQQFKNKYLLRNNSSKKNTIQTSQNLSHSLGPRSFSNSNLNNSNSSKRFQSPRDSSTKMSSHNMTNAKTSTVEPHAQTQRPVSNIQRSAPHIPLDLKRIRQRNQKYFGSQDNQFRKQAPSCLKPQDIKIQLLSENQLSSMVSPIKYLEQPNHLY